MSDPSSERAGGLTSYQRDFFDRIFKQHPIERFIVVHEAIECCPQLRSLLKTIPVAHSMECGCAIVEDSESVAALSKAVDALEWPDGPLHLMADRQECVPAGMRYAIVFPRSNRRPKDMPGFPTYVSWPYVAAHISCAAACECHVEYKLLSRRGKWTASGLAGDWLRRCVPFGDLPEVREIAFAESTLHTTVMRLTVSHSSWCMRHFDAILAAFADAAFQYPLTRSLCIGDQFSSKSSRGIAHYIDRGAFQGDIIGEFRPYLIVSVV